MCMFYSVMIFWFHKQATIVVFENHSAISIHDYSDYSHRIGWWENWNRKDLYFMVKTHGFPVQIFPTKPIHWYSKWSPSKRREFMGKPWFNHGFNQVLLPEEDSAPRTAETWNMVETPLKSEEQIHISYGMRT